MSVHRCKEAVDNVNMEEHGGHMSRNAINLDDNGGKTIGIPTISK